MSRFCDACGKFVVQQVVELLWACPLVALYNTFVAGVHVVEFGAYMQLSLCLYFVLQARDISKQLLDMNLSDLRGKTIGKVLIKHTLTTLT